jgi:hypothetical protein
MGSKNKLFIIVLVFIALESMIYYFFHRKSGGDLVFQIFSVIFLVFYGIILWAVSKPWKISKFVTTVGIVICGLLLFITLKVFM